MSAGTTSLFEPSHVQAFGATANWLQDVLSGSLATALSIIAISLVGLSLFQGRLRFMRAVSVVVGIFLLLGASVISAGVIDNLSRTVPPPTPMAIAPLPLAPQDNPARSSNPFDPYAGASVPTQ